MKPNNNGNGDKSRKAVADALNVPEDTSAPQTSARPHDDVKSELAKASEDIVRNVDTIIGKISDTVLSSINTLRIQLAELETMTLNAAAAARQGMKNQVHIANRTLETAANIEDQIRDFRELVENSLLPTSATQPRLMAPEKTPEELQQLAEDAVASQQKKEPLL